MEKTMKNNTLKSAIYGFAIGDALGVPYEFKERGTFTCTGMTGYGTWNQPAGTWSDDTSMTLATLDSINNGEFDLESIMRRFSQWMNKGSYTCDGKLFDIGNATRLAIQKYNHGYSIHNCGLCDYMSNGNGSLMRMLPLAFIDCTEDYVRAVSALTHAHSLSTEICVAYVNLTKRLIETRDVNKTFGTEYGWVKHLQAPKSTGFVVDTFFAVMWAVLNSKSYEDCVLKAVNLGNDTDTAAAIAGGWAGIIYGYENIPQSWRNTLRGKRLINSLLK